jgi:ferritin
MSLLKGILPDNWILKFFTPNEDEEVGNKIYLNIIESDVYLILKPNITRYRVIEFLKEIHNNYDELKDNITLLLEEYFEDSNYNTIQALNPFIKEKIVFMNNTNIEIEHNKNEEGYWITDIYKLYTNDKKIKLATLSANINNTIEFTDSEVENLD